MKATLNEIKKLYMGHLNFPVLREKRIHPPNPNEYVVSNDESWNLTEIVLFCKDLSYLARTPQTHYS